MEVKSCSTLLPSTVVAVTSEDTFGSVLEKVYDSPEAQVEKVTIGNGSMTHTSVDLSAVFLPLMLIGY